jgi:hypothetical protein
LPQRPGDFGIDVVNGMAWLVRALEADETHKRRKDDAEELHIQRLMPADALRIRGRHNAVNALSALALACSAGCALAPMLFGLREYRGEAHRVQPMGIIDGIEYFDDSKGTNVGATVAALCGLGEERKVVVILGGEGKGQNFTPLREPIVRFARAVVLIGRDAPLIREALAEGHERVAVVCGAWHLPALKALPPGRQDDAILKGLPKIKVGATVVPWSFDRLTFDSGYGAGARSPAFYELLWKSKPADVPTQWLLSVAHLLREADLDASPASVIEAVRLADALAAMRERPRPGLRELCDSARSILIRDEAVWSLIARRLIVGERMGEVPESVPMVPLLSDLVAHLKRLRMKQDDTIRLLQLDLRGEMDLERSQLLHRLNLLNVAWGVPEEVTGKKGTFHEHWQIQWRPELSISLIEAGIYGNTVVSAATNCAAERATKAVQLAEIATLVQQVLIADLADAIDPTVAKLQALSATSADIADLAEALPPLAAVVRYGTVRRTEAERVAPVLDAIFTRLCVGLPTSCVSLDDDAAQDMSDQLTAVSGIVTLFDNQEQSAQWLDALAAIATLEGCHRLVKGRAERLRFDFGAVDGEHLALRLGQESSAGATAQETAAFIEGLLEGPGVVLLHQELLFRAINDWLVRLTAEHFDEVLPLIRRTFALFTKPERRQIGELVAGKGEKSERVMEIHEERARRVLPFVRQILGLPNE